MGAGVHHKTLLQHQNLTVTLHSPCADTGRQQALLHGEQGQRCPDTTSGGAHTLISASFYPTACPKHPASSLPRTLQDSPTSSLLSPPRAAASAPSPALGRRHAAVAELCLSEIKRTGARLLWQVCSKYTLERGGRLASGDYTLIPRETLPPPRFRRPFPIPAKGVGKWGPVLTQLHPGVALQAAGIMKWVPEGASLYTWTT